MRKPNNKPKPYLKSYPKPQLRQVARRRAFRWRTPNMNRVININTTSATSSSGSYSDLDSAYVAATIRQDMSLARDLLQQIRMENQRLTQAFLASRPELFLQ